MQPVITQLLRTPNEESLRRIFDRIDQEINNYAREPRQLSMYTVHTGSFVNLVWAPTLWIFLQVMRVRHDTQWAR